MNILIISDITVSLLYNKHLKSHFPNLDLLISCGDLPYDYLEYLVSSLDIPFFYVLGNHDQVEKKGERHAHHPIAGGTNLHQKVTNYDGLLLAGVEGSLRYRIGPYQYSQAEMWSHVVKLIPAILINKVRYGRFLDAFLTHAAPAGIHDKPDLPHQGIFAFRWFIEVFKPRFHFHGHVHVYRPDEAVETLHGNTKVINAFGYKTIEFN